MRRMIIITAIVAAALFTGGWIFRRMPSAPKDALYAFSRAGADVSIRHDPSIADDAADRAAAELRDKGWSETPVSVRTFHLLTRDNDIIALVAEDIPSGGSRITTIHKRHALN